MIDIGSVSLCIDALLRANEVVFLILSLCKYLFLIFTVENKLKVEPGKYYDR